MERNPDLQEVRRFVWGMVEFAMHDAGTRGHALFVTGRGALHVAHAVEGQLSLR